LPNQKDNSTSSFSAFTIEYSGKAREIISAISISPPIAIVNNTISHSEIPKLFETNALWDTGATGCVITPKAVSELNLSPISIAKVTHAGGISNSNVYLINIYLPNNIVIPGVRVTECTEYIDKFNVIIGMDVITLGDFSITNVAGKSTFSFRIPSFGTIDYVKESNKINYSIFKNIGRNQQCPCGSGKKFKDCHLSIVANYLN